MSVGATAFAWLLIAAATPVAACGHCVDDKVAAAYDHAVVSRAVALGHELVFLSLEFARPVTRRTEAAIRVAVERIPSVDRGSVRVAVEAGGLSFAFDPTRAPAGTVLDALDRAMAPLDARTAVLRFGDPGKSSGPPGSQAVGSVSLQSAPRP